MPNQTFPYAEILKPLVESTMKAQRELFLSLVDGTYPDGISDVQLNRHFSWLALVYPQGTNRHLFDAAEGQFPLRTAYLLNRGRDDDDPTKIVKMPSAIRKCLLERRSLDVGYKGNSEEKRNASRYIQDGPTRISSLIRNAFEEVIQVKGVATYNKNFWKSAIDEKGFYLRSPLSIVYDYLTIPSAPGSRAYALLALRNFLFEEFEIVPDLNAGWPQVFTVIDIEKSRSHIWTSMRRRYLSKGEDKLPPEGRGIKKVDALIRQFLAMKGVLYLRFREVDACKDYLNAGLIRPKRVAPDKRYAFEFSKSPYLEKLPETGELVNELMGLPLPIRGAETLFRGGLKFSSRQGLVMAIHGGPGTVKTSVALALAAYVAPFEIETNFLTAEEDERDLRDRIVGLVSDDIRGLSFFPGDLRDRVGFSKIKLSDYPEGNALELLEEELGTLAKRLEETQVPSPKDIQSSRDGFLIPKPCRAIIVLDGLHDLFTGKAQAGVPSSSEKQNIPLLYQLIETLKKLKALVILTTGNEWVGDTRLDYLVDVSIELSHRSMAEYGAKPDRRLLLSKARHQLCANGTHGFQIAGVKGVRFSPQINYSLDRRSIWKMRLPNTSVIKTVLRRVTNYQNIEKFKSNQNKPKSIVRGAKFFDSNHCANIFGGSHIFLNGEGSGGKAALALKIAIAPSFSRPLESGTTLKKNEKVLIVSFLYPREYYETILDDLRKLHNVEYGIRREVSRIEVIHLYPGHLKPNDLYNKIEWELDAAELRGDPYTCVIIDGIHNVFLQFPQIEAYHLFWPQIYNSLRSRPLMTITTHTTLSISVPGVLRRTALTYRADDDRSEPLRHALVQKTDFQFEIGPYESLASGDMGNGKNETARVLSDMFVVRTLSAINQAIPKGHVVWGRETLILVEDPSIVSGNTETTPDSVPLRRRKLRVGA